MKKETRNKLESELQKYNKILLNNPFEPNILYKKANILFSLKQYKQALSVYDLLLKNEPENPNLWIKRAYTLFKIAGYKERNRWDMAELGALLMKSESIIIIVNEDLSKALDISFNLMKNQSTKNLNFFESDMEYAEAWGILNKIFYSLGRITQHIEATQAYNKICKEIQKSRREFERKRNAIWNYNKMLSEDNEDADSWYNIGQMLEEVNEYETAGEAYEKAAQLYYRKGGASIKSHLYETAHDSFKMVLKIKPELEYAWSKSGYVLIKQGKFKDAINNCNRALELNPKCAEAWYFRSIALAKLKMYNDSLISYDKTLEIDPEFVEALNGKGRVLTEVQRYDEALEYYEKALKLKSENPVLWCNKCFVLRKLSRYEEALDACEKSLKVDPNYYKALFNRACILEKLNRNEESKLAYNKAANSFYAFGNHFLKNRDFNKAIEFYDNVLRIVPTHIGALGKKGSTLAKLGCIKEALILIDKALDTDSKCAEIWFIKSEIYYQDEDIKKARECYEKAFQLDQNIINLNPSLGKKISNYQINSKNVIDGSIETKKRKNNSTINWYDEDNPINRYGLYK